MEDLKINFSKNLIKLRKSINYTQADLALKLNYSDKAISKWERAESMPDIYMIKKMADFFGVSIDYLLQEHKDNELIQPSLNNEAKIKRMHLNHLLIVGVSVIGIWAISLIIFIFLRQIKINNSWLCFIASMPISFLISFIFACIWGRRIQRFWLLSGFTWSLITFIYLLLLVLDINLWLIFVLGVPSQIIEILSFRIHKTSKMSNN